ncbi:MAG: DUF6130 family protein, partial [Cyanobacteriota bacterium]|nr:DUF6130 family protein [Cyanobacteriota bacterium]
MLVFNYRQIWMRTLLSLIAIALSWSLLGCSDRIETSLPPEKSVLGSPAVKLAEVSPPAVLQQLRSQLEAYQPQVAIVEPKADEVLETTTVSVKLQVQDLPIFKNAELEMGPHLHLILDNQPYRAVYNADEPIIFENLEPGTHTLRVFAARPWHESFKNEGAYAQTTFHLFAPTQSNAPETSKPLLTYSRPKGSYGAEPILIDFYLTNAPLHLVAAEDPEDEIEDWRVRVTVDGKSFLVDTWQPLYLTGFQPGQNWVKLELLDEEGNPTDNAFNTTVRLIEYQPNGQDTLSQLVRGELSVADAQGIVDPNYIPPTPPEEAPTVEEEPTQPDILEEPAIEETQPTPTQLTQPSIEEETPAPAEIEPSTEVETPAAEAEPTVEPEEQETPAPVEIEPSTEMETPTVEEEPTLEEMPAPEIEEVPSSPSVEPEMEVAPTPAVEPSTEMETPAVEEEAPLEEIPTPEVEEIPSPPSGEPAVEIVPTPAVEPSTEMETPVVEEELKVEEIPASEVEEMTAEAEEAPSPPSGEPEMEVVPTPAVEPSTE